MSPNLARLLPRRPGRRGAGGALHRRYRRADGKGRTTTPGCSSACASRRSRCCPAAPRSEVVPELGPEPDDLVLTRLHGLDPMAGTDLDPVLRNLGVTHDRRHRRVGERRRHQPRDGRGEPRLPGRRAPRRGVRHPAEYADAVIDNTLALLATDHHHRRPARRWEALSADGRDGRPGVRGDLRWGTIPALRALGGGALRRRRGRGRRRRAPRRWPSSRDAGRPGRAAFLAAGHRARRPGGDLGAQLLGVGRRAARPAVGRRRASCRSTPGTRAPRRPTSSSASRARLLVTVNGFLGNDYVGMLARPRPARPRAHRRAARGDGRRPGTVGVGRLPGHRRRASTAPSVDAPASPRSAPTTSSDILFTSGTTGQPKGVVCTHGQTLRALRRLGRRGRAARRRPLPRRSTRSSTPSATRPASSPASSVGRHARAACRCSTSRP